jgi:hypothetical protein
VQKAKTFLQQHYMSLADLLKKQTPTSQPHSLDTFPPYLPYDLSGGSTSLSWAGISEETIQQHSRVVCNKLANCQVRLTARITSSSNSNVFQGEIIDCNATDTGRNSSQRLCLVKYCCIEVDLELQVKAAECHLSPDILFAGQLPGSVYVTVMEWLDGSDGWQSLTEYLNKVKSQLDGAAVAEMKTMLCAIQWRLCRLLSHDSSGVSCAVEGKMASGESVEDKQESFGRVAHGDFRTNNIMVQCQEGSLLPVTMKVVDLDWMGREGTRTYPDDISTSVTDANQFLPYSEVTKIAPGKLIISAHDVAHLEAIFHRYF